MAFNNLFISFTIILIFCNIGLIHLKPTDSPSETTTTTSSETTTTSSETTTTGNGTSQEAHNTSIEGSTSSTTTKTTVKTPEVHATPASNAAIEAKDTKQPNTPTGTGNGDQGMESTKGLGNKTKTQEATEAPQQTGEVGKGQGSEEEVKTTETTTKASNEKDTVTNEKGLEGGDNEQGKKVTEHGNNEAGENVTEEENKESGGKVTEEGNKEQGEEGTENGGKGTEQGNKEPGENGTEQGNIEPGENGAEKGNKRPVEKGAEEEDRKQAFDQERKYYHDEMEDSPSAGHFMAYFLTAVVLCIAGYIIFHNKQKIVAFIVEGRGGKKSRRPSKSGYSKLKPKVDEVMPSVEQSSKFTNYVY